MGSIQRRRLELLERRSGAGARIFVIQVRDGDEDAIKSWEAHLKTERNMGSADLLVVLRRFSDEPLEYVKEYQRT